MTQQRWTITFAPLDAGEYQVTVKRSGSVHRFKTRLPPDISDLWTTETKSAGTVRSFRSGIETMSPEAQFFGAGNMPTLKEIGERIMDAMLDVGNGTEGIKVLGALEDRVADASGLELQFDLSQTPELSGIPWEAAYLKSKDRFLAIGTSSNVVRKLDAQSELPPPIERPIRILVAAANPYDDLNTGFELGNIERRIQELVASGDTDFEVEALQGTTREQFRRKVIDWQPHIIHYIGHSAFKDGSGYLYFEAEGEDKKSDRVSAEVLRNILLNRRPWVVVLNSCESGKTSSEHPMGGVAQDLLGRINIPFVVGMQQPVSDDAAIAFSQDFYAALTDGETIACAVSLGRNAIATQADERTQIELITPALYTSGETDRIAFVESNAAAGTAAVAAAAADSGGKSGGFLSNVDTKLKVVVSIIGSVGIIATAISGGFTSVYECITGETCSVFGGDDVEGNPDTGKGDDSAGNGGEDESFDPNSAIPIRNTVSAGRAQNGPRPIVLRPGERVPAQSGSGNTGAGFATGGVVDAAPRTIVRTVAYAGGGAGAVPVSEEVALQYRDPPPLPSVVGAMIAIGEGQVPTPEEMWQFTLSQIPVPYCEGLRETIPFEFASADLDRDARYTLSRAKNYVANCKLASIALSAYAETDEQAAWLATGPVPVIGQSDLIGAATAQPRIIGRRHYTVSWPWGVEPAPATDLSYARAVTVMNALSEGGVAVGHFDLQPNGSARMQVIESGPEAGETPETDKRVVEIYFEPQCPAWSEDRAKYIRFAHGTRELDDAGRDAVQSVIAALDPDARQIITVTGAPATTGDDIFGDAEARVRAVMAALPIADQRDTKSVRARIVSWQCRTLLDQDADNVAIEVEPDQTPQSRLIPDPQY